MSYIELAELVYGFRCLFEEARYNLLTRGALGLVNNDDEPPTESTYYLLRQKIVDYEKERAVREAYPPDWPFTTVSPCDRIL
ncbi:hypothetical protein FACS1894137_02110 [Spirochaetia bacterium]|nr:hypothetical protein FACS1894137_02110 [Spirochaetia bacterium]